MTQAERSHRGGAPLSADVSVDVTNWRCCACGRQLNQSWGKQAPVAGAFMMCFVCTAVQVLGDDLTPRALTAEEAAYVSRNPDFDEARRAILSIPAHLREA
jgi:hypothetical protein